MLSRNNQSVAYRFENVVIAQGNNGASNNWWFGGVSANSLENNRIILDGAGESHDKIAITCQRGGNSLNHIDILQVFNQMEWMKKLNPSLSLKQINMVGTHDTGTYCASGVEKPWVKTQTLTTAEQLRAGIRYLDVRCHHISDTLTIHHSDWSMNLFFSDLLEDCVSFLKYNPSETIVMQVKEEHGDADQTTNTRTFYETFKVYIDRYPDMWCLSEGIPCLKEAQGKIILVRRFPLTGTSVPVSLGIDTPFKNDATFDIATPNGVLKIQDQYKFLSNEHKWSAVSAFMAESSNNNQGQWFINFTSAASNTITAITQTPESIAQTINNKLVGALANYKFVGTIIMDFPDIPSITLTIEKVINKNFDNPMFS